MCCCAFGRTRLLLHWACLVSDSWTARSCHEIFEEMFKGRDAIKHSIKPGARDSKKRRCHDSRVLPETTGTRMALSGNRRTFQPTIDSSILPTLFVLTTAFGLILRHRRGAETEIMRRFATQVLDRRRSGFPGMRVMRHGAGSELDRQHPPPLRSRKAYPPRRFTLRAWEID